MKAVITVIGQDTVGVVAKVSAVCAELNINIEDVSQSIMQDMFCMIMLVDLSKANAEAAEVRDRFAALGKEMKMQVTVTRQEVFDATHMLTHPMISEFINPVYEAVKKITVVTNNEHRTVKLANCLLKYILGFHVKMVGRLVKDEKIHRLKQQLYHGQPTAFTST